MGDEFSAYDAIAIADPLHQIEQGIFGKHMWPKLVKIIGRANCGILDQRCVSFYFRQFYFIF